VAAGRPRSVGGRSAWRRVLWGAEPAAVTSPQNYSTLFFAVETPVLRRRSRRRGTLPAGCVSNCPWTESSPASGHATDRSERPGFRRPRGAASRGRGHGRQSV